MVNLFYIVFGSLLFFTTHKIITGSNNYLPNVRAELNEEDIIKEIGVGEKVTLIVKKPSIEKIEHIKDCYLFSFDKFDDYYNSAYEKKQANFMSEKWASKIIYPLTNDTCSFTIKKFTNEFYNKWLVVTDYVEKINYPDGDSRIVLWTKIDRLELTELSIVSKLESWLNN